MRLTFSYISQDIQDFNQFRSNASLFVSLMVETEKKISKGHVVDVGVCLSRTMVVAPALDNAIRSDPADDSN